MIDMVALCFSIWFVAGLIAILSSSRQNKFRQAMLVIATAGTLAMACGSKMNSLVVVVLGGVCGLSLVARWWRSKQRTELHLIAMLVAVFILAGVTCVATNPTLYVDTLDGILALSYEHRMTADIQEQLFGGRLRTVGSRVVALSELVCGAPLMFVVLLAVVSLKCYLAFRDKTRFAVVVVWWWVAFAMLLAWLPFAWDRYALPLVPPTVLVIGSAIEDLMQLVWNKVRQQSRVA